jgi:hypothetical protein
MAPLQFVSTIATLEQGLGRTETMDNTAPRTPGESGKETVTR